MWREAEVALRPDLPWRGAGAGHGRDRYGLVSQARLLSRSFRAEHAALHGPWAGWAARQKHTSCTCCHRRLPKSCQLVSRQAAQRAQCEAWAWLADQPAGRGGHNTCAHTRRLVRWPPHPCQPAWPTCCGTRSLARAHNPRHSLPPQPLPQICQAAAHCALHPCSRRQRQSRHDTLENEPQQAVRTPTQPSPRRCAPPATACSHCRCQRNKETVHVRTARCTLSQAQHHAVLQHTFGLC